MLLKVYFLSILMSETEVTYLLTYYFKNASRKSKVNFQEKVNTG